jgi:hypothetical protein
MPQRRGLWRIEYAPFTPLHVTHCLWPLEVMSATLYCCYSCRRVSLAWAHVRKIHCIVTRACALGLSFIVVLLQIFLKCRLLNNVREASTETRISRFAGTVLALHSKARIKGDIESVQESIRERVQMTPETRMQTAYFIPLATFSHPSGRLIPGWGQAGQRSAHSPGWVSDAPRTGSWPLPVRLRSLRCLHWRTMRSRVG